MDQIRIRTLLFLMTFINITSCTSEKEMAYGPVICRQIAKVSNLNSETVTPLGFSAEEFLANVERTNHSLPFEWLMYDENLITSSSPPLGGETTAEVSIIRASTPPRFFQSTHPSCISWLEVDVLYTINTADGLLAESVLITLSNIQFVIIADGTIKGYGLTEGSGETNLQQLNVNGSLRLSTTLGENLRGVLGLIVKGGKTYGGLSARYDVSVTKIEQKLLGRWTPFQNS